ncbi:MAG: RsbRD N-terminal domain-containing protein [Candidatus Omnitrophota bacterium]
MKLLLLLASKKKRILEKWFERIVNCYPSDANHFLTKERDRFNNPIGFTLREGIGKILDALLQESEPDAPEESLGDIVRLMAVQDFTPSQAVEFLFLLKEILWEEDEEKDRRDEWRELESRIDRMALLAFDGYMKCREAIYEIKANQVKNRTLKLLERSHLVSVWAEENEDCGSCSAPDAHRCNGGHNP